MAGPKVSKLGLQYFTDQDLLEDEEFEQNKFITNGFYYCQDPTLDHLTGLQFFVETPTDLYTLQRVGSPLGSNCYGLRIYKGQAFDQIVVHYNDEYVTGLTITVADTERVFGSVDEGGTTETFIFEENKPLVGIYGWNSAVYVANMGVLRYDLDLCPKDMGKGEVEDEDVALFDSFVENQEVI